MEGITFRVDINCFLTVETRHLTTIIYGRRIWATVVVTVHHVS